MTTLLAFIIIVAFLDTFIQLPLMTPYALELGASLGLTGAIVAIYSLTNIAGNLVGGYWIDRYGRKRMLLTGMSAVFFILLLYPVAQTGEHLFVIRFIHGLAGGVLIPAAFAYVGDLTPRGRRGKAMAFTGASIGTAAIIGPAIGGMMAARSQIEVVFLFVALLFLITSVLVFLYLEETIIPAQHGAFQWRAFAPLIRHPLLMQAALAAFAFMVSNGTLAFALPLSVQALGLSMQTTGLLFSTFGVMALIVFLTPLNKIYDRFAPVALITTGLLLISVALTLLSLLASLPGYVGAMIIYGIGFSLIFPSMNKMVADASTVLDRGKAYGLFYAFFSLGAVTGSALSGALAELGHVPFRVGAFIMCLTALLLVVIAKRTKANEKNL